MVRISEEYRALNERCHMEHERWGSTAYRWADDVSALAEGYDCKSILDYGAGKQTLADALEDVTSYDPCIPSISTPPEGKYDLVACLDVMEHVEERHILAVLEHIEAHMGTVGLFVISTRLAHKILPDGRNAHITVKPREWWTDKLKDHFTIVHIMDNLDKRGRPVEIEAIVTPKPRGQLIND